MANNGSGAAANTRRGQKSASVALDLPADRLAYLHGKPAPELRKIKEWKDGAAVKLSDLRGKVVVLDFWGYWCGPCVHEMPELVELHDKFADQGLVIVAIHDDSVGSMAELEAKSSRARQEIWGGRELPFHVAIDGGGRCKVPRRDRYTRGATTALYGINGFPTTLVIDKRGVLTEDPLPIGTEWAEKRIRELLRCVQSGLGCASPPGSPENLLRTPCSGLAAAIFSRGRPVRTDRRRSP